MKKTTELVFTAVMAALCCILGPLSVPIGAVPISLTIIAVFLCVFALKTKLGTLAVIIYLLLGLVGLPVFSGFSGGVAKVAGPTGGYLVGYIFLALIAGLAIDKSYDFTGVKRYVCQIAGMVLGVAVCYLFGTIWFVVMMDVTFGYALGVCVIPFIPVDALKIVICIVLGNALRKALSSARLVQYRTA